MEEEWPQLVLPDLMLPGTDGITLMQEMLSTVDVPVIFLSAYGRDEFIATACGMGAVDYVVKPFSPTELTARIAAALRRREVLEPSGPYVLGDDAGNPTYIFTEPRVGYRMTKGETQQEDR